MADKNTGLGGTYGLESPDDSSDLDPNASFGKNYELLQSGIEAKKVDLAEKRAKYEAIDPNDMSLSQSAGAALLAAIPTILGRAFGGNAGGVSGAKAGGEASQSYFARAKEIREKEKRLAASDYNTVAKDISSDESQSNKFLTSALQQKATADQRKTDRQEGYQNQLSLMKQKEELVATRPAKPNTHNDLRPGEVSNLSTVKSGGNEISGVRNLLSKIPSGGVNDNFVREAKSYSLDTNEGKALSALALLEKTIAKGLEGGRLSDLDFKTYKEIMEGKSNKLTSAKAISDFLGYLENKLQNKGRTDLDALKRAGRNVVGFEGYFDAPSSAPTSGEGAPPPQGEWPNGFTTEVNRSGTKWRYVPAQR